MSAKQKILSLYTEIKYTTKFAIGGASITSYTITILNHIADYKKYHNGLSDVFDIYEEDKLILQNRFIEDNQDHFFDRLWNLIETELLLKKIRNVGDVMQNQACEKIQMYFDTVIPKSPNKNRYGLVYPYVEMSLMILNEIDKKNEYVRTANSTISISRINTFDFGDKLGYVDFTKLLSLVENVILLKKN